MESRGHLCLDFCKGYYIIVMVPLRALPGWKAGGREKGLYNIVTIHQEKQKESG